MANNDYDFDFDEYLRNEHLKAAAVTPKPPAPKPPPPPSDGEQIGYIAKIALELGFYEPGVIAEKVFP